MGDGVTTYSNLETAHPMWAPTAIKAAQQGHAKDLYRPPGYEGGGFTLWHGIRKSDGMVRWRLSYKHYHKFDGRYIYVAKWLTDWLPPEDQMKRRPGRCFCATQGRTVIVSKTHGPRRSENTTRQIRVLLDADGLPVPIPEPLWAAYGLE